MRQGTTEKRTWKVGELAGRTGLSVRTLHHYDEVGLLSPSGRTEAGHRLYSAGDVLRLQQIRSLRALGFSLQEIRRCLDAPDFSVQRVIELHISGLQEQVRLQQQLLRRLEVVAARLRSAEEVSAEEFVQTAMEVIEMSDRLEKYYSPQQLEELEQRRRMLGEESIRQAEEEWSQLIEDVRTEMEKGTDPASERVQPLARRWMELVHAFTAGDPQIERSLANMWQQEQTIHGIDTRSMRQMMEYISRAAAASDHEEQR